MDTTGLLLGLSNVGCGVLSVALSVPLLMGRVKMNGLYGVRIKGALLSEENWQKINRYGAKWTIVWSLPLVLIGLATFFVDFDGAGDARTALITAFACAPLVLAIPAVQAYVYARRL